MAQNQIAARWATFNFWQQHQNFAVFVLPQSLQHNPRVHLLLRVTGSGEFFMGDRTSDLGTWENESPPPGFYLSRNYITTRAAWQLFWQGHRNTLSQPCHWVMVIAQRS
ncbi:MAG: hypothetical protein HC919_01120 [Oscillatoriales cyanobacterium SM2_2_1]|nr:hypothetical protein [Oscillatoriales cyanobacterium SM2_2_1]